MKIKNNNTRLMILCFCLFLIFPSFKTEGILVNEPSNNVFLNHQNLESDTIDIINRNHRNTNNHIGT